VFWNVGLKGLGPTRAVSYTYAISPLAVLIGATMLDEPVTAWLVLGGMLVVGGIAAAQGVSLPQFSGVLGRRRAAASRSPS
jgi:drug/metabolite transporter (DMT)-like permease